jgi:hypothetical protein
MARKRFKPEEIVAKLRQVEVLQSQGMAAADAIRQIGVTEVTYYLYGRLSRCNSMDGSPVASRFRTDPPGPLQTSIRRHPIRSGRPNGESARARLYSW